MRDEKHIQEPVSFVPIGVIHSPFTDLTGMPIQPTGAHGIKGSVEIFGEYTEGLKDIEGFSHLFLVYTFPPLLIIPSHGHTFP